MADLLEVDVRAFELKSASTDSLSSNHSQYIDSIYSGTEELFTDRGGGDVENTSLSADDDDKVQTKMENLLNDPILRPLLDDLCQWLANILSIDIHATNFTIPLQTGSDLCCLAEAISKKATENGMKCPKLVFKKGAKPGSFQARCNMEAFVRWAKALGVRETCLFETVDLVELKFLRNVLICLLEVSKLADKYGVEPPELVKLEKTTKIGWQDLIKLSMKSEGTKKVMSVSDISETVNTLHKQATETNVDDPEAARAALMHHMAEDVMTVTRQLSVMRKWKQFVKKRAEAEAELVITEDIEVIEITEDDIDDEPIFVEEEFITNVESQPFSLEGPRSEDDHVTSYNEDEESLPDFQLKAEPELKESDLVKLAFTVCTLERETKTDQTSVERETKTDQTSVETDRVMVLESEDLSEVKLPEVELAEEELPEVELPEEELPEVELPEVELPEVELPEVELPEVELEEVTRVESGAVTEVVNTIPSDKEERASEEDPPSVSEEEVRMVEEEASMVESGLPEEEGSMLEEELSMVESAEEGKELPGFTLSVEFISKKREEMVPAAASAPEETPVEEEETNSQAVQKPVQEQLLAMSTTDSQAGLVEEDRLSGYTDVGWTMVLCFPAIRVNNDGSALSSEQLEKLELKRLKVLLLGIILVLMGSSMAIICGVFGLQTTSVVEFQISCNDRCSVGYNNKAGFNQCCQGDWNSMEKSGDTEEVEETKGDGLPAGCFYTLLVIALVFIIIGLSLITIWVCQTIKIRQLRNRTFVEKGTSYGTIAQ